MSKIPLCTMHDVPRDSATSPLRTLHWRSAEPFVVNHRAILVHRIRSGRSHTNNGRWTHDSVSLWCGNGFTGSLECVSEPPTGRLLCARCEAIAVAAGQPTADELAGRHVCVGRVKAERLCCRKDSN